MAWTLAFDLACGLARAIVPQVGTLGTGLGTNNNRVQISQHGINDRGRVNGTGAGGGLLEFVSRKWAYTMKRWGMGNGSL